MNLVLLVGALGWGCIQWFGTGGFFRVVHALKRDVTILASVYLNSRGGGIVRRHEVQPFIGWLGNRETAGRT